MNYRKRNERRATATKAASPPPFLSLFFAMILQVVVVRDFALALVWVLLGSFSGAAANALHLQQVAYEGDTVTLSSSGNSTQALLSITWSVFSNQTWIATFHSGKINTDRFFLFKGRLTLDGSSGDLTIRNVTQADAVDYSVEIVDAKKRTMERVVTLMVKKHLRKPSIRTLFSVNSDGGCWVGLHCLSVDLDGNLSWTLEPPLGIAYFDLDAKVLLANVRNITLFTCTSSRNKEEASDSISVACVTASGRWPRLRISLCVLAGIVGGGVLMAVLLKRLRGSKRGSANIVAHQHYHYPPPNHQQDEGGGEGRGAEKEDKG